MKALLALAAIAAGSALVFAVVGTGATGSAAEGKTLTVVEHATTDAVTNPGSGGQADNVGDILTFANDVFDERDRRRVGSDQGFCVRIVVGAAWECVWTTFLADGQITVEGPFFDTRDSRLAVTGGTGDYSNSRGWMQLSSREGGTKFEFAFHLIG
jgi:hypothetical protein